MAMLVSTEGVAQCSYGNFPGLFTASSENVSATTPAGVVTDFKEDNITPFGMCSAPTNPDVIAAQGSPVPCVPVLSAWTPGAARVKVNGVIALDARSKCMCTWAGEVSVTDSWQERVTSE
jgi:hypothetical protein